MRRKASKDRERPEYADQTHDHAHEHTRHEVHRHGEYLDIDGEIDVAYGDGTPESLLDRLREPTPDRWESHRDGWTAVHPAWARRSRDEADR